MSAQQQFLTVIDRDEAERRFQAALSLSPRGSESVPLAAAWGRVLADDVWSPVDVPSFDRSNFDGYALRAADTFGASENQARRLALAPREIATGTVCSLALAAGSAIAIATGGMLPRGADAVVMIEHCHVQQEEDVQQQELVVRRAVAPGQGVMFAGTDIAAGELVLPAGTPLTSRETGVLAAIGAAVVNVVRRPRVAILSTGNEIIAPGQAMHPPLVYDSNARIIADAVRELGCEPLELGIVPDDAGLLRTRLHEALGQADAVLLSGGTSKGAGDVSYHVVGELRDPGIVAHGVALKPGKPICLAVSAGKPVVVLPGFPTSAVFTFHEFVAPVLRRFAGLAAGNRPQLPAELAVKINSEIGRTEYVLVGLVAKANAETPDANAVPGGADAPTATAGYIAYPLGKGSGSVTTFSQADGFLTIGRHEEIVEAGAPVTVTLLGRDLLPADLVVIGSHCVGLDLLLSAMQRRGWRTRFVAVGSTAGLAAAQRGECDVAGLHLLDPQTGIYNRPFLVPGLEFVAGYGRMQGVVHRPDDVRWAGRTAAAAIAAVKDDPACLMVNRNAGSGTRLLIDRLLGGSQPAGYAVQAKSHNAVAAAVAQGRADWGLAIASAAARAGLGFLPLAEEQFDFVIPTPRRQRPAVQEFVGLLHEPALRQRLRAEGLRVEG